MHEWATCVFCEYVGMRKNQKTEIGGSAGGGRERIRLKEKLIDAEIKGLRQGWVQDAQVRN